MTEPLPGVERQMTLLLMAARVDANLRQAAADVDEYIAQQAETIRRLEGALRLAVHEAHDLADFAPHKKHRRWQDCPAEACRQTVAALTSTEANHVE